jgi:2-oxoisovalerate dehydrogenase E1 component
MRSTPEEHPPAYDSDGHYWSMPNVESIFNAIYEMMHEVDSVKYPNIY